MEDCSIQEIPLGDQLKKRISEVFGGSLHIRHVDTGSCNGCDFEMTVLSNPIYDIARFGVSFVPSPRHADVLMVTGGVTANLAKALKITYEAAAEPKAVLVVGACAIGGGVIGETYANAGGVDSFVPVYAYVPGCPPRPEALIQGILLILDKYDKILKRGGRNGFNGTAL